MASDDSLFGHSAFRYAGWAARMWQWTLMMGIRKFQEMVFTGRPFTAEEMREVHFVNSVVPRDGLEAETMKYALACARSMLRSVGEWNSERRARAEPEIKLAVGVHYGPVLLGNIGDERRLEFATIGETVNVASRLEGLTRPLNSSVILSDALVAAVRREDGEAEGDLAAFRRLERQRLRGYDQEMALWVLAQDGA